MSSREEQEQFFRTSPQEELESPFLTEELFVEESGSEWEARLTALELESPFQSAFEQQDRNTLVEVQELEETYNDEEEWSDEDDFLADELEAQNLELYENRDLDRDIVNEALFELLEAEASISTERSSGISPLALASIKEWGAKSDRPKEWQGRVYGLVVHTTGSGLPKRALKDGISPTEWAVRYYKRSRGCHYVNGWSGMGGGELVQVANERFQAWGVGVTNKHEPSKDQRRSIELGRFEKDLPPILVTLWRKRWPNYSHSLKLLPNTRYANSCYIHVESPPCVYHGDKGLVTGAEPLRAGLRFTKAQHDTVAHLAVDIAHRNGWPTDVSWWRTPRLLGHEDLTPIARHDKRGGWDPGYLREKPYFDWDYVYGIIEQILQRGSTASGAKPGQPVSALFASLGSMAKKFWELISSGQEHLAISLAIQQGQTDENKLTNLIFFARHPKLNGRRIRSDEQELAQEWLQIRGQLVRPILQFRNGSELFVDQLNQELNLEALQGETELAEGFVEEFEEEDREDFLYELEDRQLDDESSEETFAHFNDDQEEEFNDEEFIDELEDMEINEELDEETFKDFNCGELEYSESEDFIDAIDTVEHEVNYELPLVNEVTFPSGESLQIVAGLPEGKYEDYWDPTNSGNPLIDTGSAHKDKKLSANFTVRELTTSGGRSSDIARIDPKLVECLQKLRDQVCKGVNITSGYRSWKRNKQVYAGRKNPDGTPKKPTLSQHCGGRAVDIKISGMNGFEIGKAAIEACGPNIGIGLGSHFAHIDIRGYSAAWNYGGAKSSWITAIKRIQNEKGGTRKQPTVPASKTNTSSHSSTTPTADLVRFAQRVLNAAEGERLKVDGDLGKFTRGALERFRNKFGLGSGGILDGPTQLALAQRALEEIAQQSLFAKLGLLDTNTEQVLKRFKSKRRLGFDATLDKATFDALAAALTQSRSSPRAPVSGSPSESLDRIMQVATDSEIARYRWRDRGRAPRGYIKGMALVYARVYCKLKAGDAAAGEMAKANTGNPDKDALAHYAQEFKDVGMANHLPGNDTLRHLFVLLIGLGMRESSGRYCEGRDKSATNVKAETAEAGLFQTSFNIRTANPLLRQLFSQYLANPSGFEDVFREGISCRDSDLENFGEGEGREFQRLSKKSPAFAAEFTAVGLRNRRKHWGPINRKAAEIRPECDAMLLQVEKIVDEFNLCQALA